MIVDIGSIQHEAVGIGPASVDVESRPRAKVKRSASLPRAHADDAGLQESEVIPTSAVQRQVPNGSFVHQGTHGGSGRFHQRRFLGDRDLVGKLSYLEREVNYRRPAHGERDSASDFCLKTRELGVHFIIAQRQIGSGVTAPLVGRSGSGDSRIYVLNCDRHSRDDGSRGILYDAQNCSVSHLGRNQVTAQKHTHQQHWQVSRHVALLSSTKNQPRGRLYLVRERNALLILWEVSRSYRPTVHSINYSASFDRDSREAQAR